MNKNKYCIFLLSLLLLGSPSLQAASIDTTGSWDGSESIEIFGTGGGFGSATFGQTITATPANQNLQSFTFKIEVSTGPLTFYGYVYAWDGTKAVGPALFRSSSPVTLPQNPGVFSTVTFNTGGIALTSGQQYVLFGSISETPVTASESSWGFVNNAYSGGALVLLNNGTDTSGWTNTAWVTLNNGDLAFVANFADPPPPPPPPASPVPTLSGIGVILLVGLLGGFVFWRRFPSG